MGLFKPSNRSERVMREIKFRAWDTKFNSWINPKDVQVNGLGQVFIFQDENLEWYEDRIGQAKILKDTQLKDKNGKEIFEGDIVVHQIYSPTIIKSVEHFIRMKVDVERYDWQILKHYGFKVIGNIYENPSLLSPKKSEEA